MITALAGGVGAAKLIEGFVQVLPPEDLTVIVNTGDNIELYGLYIAPDLDILTYTLAGIVNTQFGWGIEHDTFHSLDSLLRFHNAERWFNLGDRDLATHIFRTQQMRQGVPLSTVTEKIRQTLHVDVRILPMSDAHTPTTIVTNTREMHFQEYLVRQRTVPQVQELRFENIAAAQPAPGVREAIQHTDAIVICPSNPLISIGPILAVPGMREMLKQTAAPVLAVSPLVGGKSLKGPSDKMLSQLGYQVSAKQVAEMYQDILDGFIIDEEDAHAEAEIAALGLKVFVTKTVMRGAPEKSALAQFTLHAIEQLQTQGSVNN